MLQPFTKFLKVAVLKMLENSRKSVEMPVNVGSASLIQINFLTDFFGDNCSLFSTTHLRQSDH